MQNKTLCGPFIINQFDTFYLYEKSNNTIVIIKIFEDLINFISEDNKIEATNFFENNLKDSIKYIIYKDLKTKGFFITNGFKYGIDFLLYRGNIVNITNIATNFKYIII